jgi:RNA polymerase sigma-70 factor (ECF subfamily)
VGAGPNRAGPDGADQTGAFDGAYREYASEVCAYLQARDVEDPEAAAQEVFLALYLSLRNARGGPRKLRMRIFAIAHDLAADSRRRRLRSPIEIEYDPAEDLRVVGSPEDEVLGNGQVLLEGLPWDYREVLALRVIADLSAEATAWVMGRSPRAVKQLQRRALARLNGTLAEQRTAEGQ